MYLQWCPVVEWLVCLTFFEVRLLIWRLVVRFSMPSPLPICISTVCAYLTASWKASCSHNLSIRCGRLKIPWVSKSVGSSFLLTNSRLIEKRLFRLIQDRQYKSSRGKKAQLDLPDSKQVQLYAQKHSLLSCASVTHLCSYPLTHAQSNSQEPRGMVI